MLQRLSLKAQILLLVTCVVVIALSLLAFMTFYQIRNELERSLVQKGISISNILVENLGPGLDFQDSSYISDIAQIAFTDQEVKGVSIFNKNAEMNYIKITDSTIYDLIYYCNRVTETSIKMSDDYCKIEQPIYFRGDRVGYLWLVISRDKMLARIHTSVKFIVSGAGAVLALVFLISMIFSRKIVKPIKTFESAADRIRSGDLISPIELGSVHKDFMNLGKLFNEMQSSLKSAFLKLREAKENLEVRVQMRTMELRNELAERKKAEHALRKNDSLLRSTIESTADGILVINEDGEVTHTNSRFVEMWKISSKIMGPVGNEQYQEFIKDQVVNPNEFIKKERNLFISTLEDFETINLTDGRVFEKYSCPLITDGKLSGRVWSFRDATERIRNQEKQKKLQEDLEKAERMESLGLLAGGVAHDLNNMLGPLVAYPDLIIEKIEEENLVRSYAETMKVAAKSAASVIQDLLTLARRGRYEMSAIDLNEVIREYLNSPNYRTLTDNFGNVTMKIDLASEALISEGSPPHLIKVIMNLIVNAFDAMPDGGLLTVETYQQEVLEPVHSYEPIATGLYNIIRVKDTGSGIEGKDLGKIFEPYYSKKKMGSSGSGLGLSVVYGVVKDHGGYYDIISKVGLGTQFVLYFPVSDKKLITEVKVDSDLKGQGTILIVDDNAGQREMAQVLLETLGYNVTTAIHGHAALDYLQDHAVDLILLDMIMEDNFDGLDTYREILKIHPGQKALIVSGYSATERVNELQSLGAGKYIRKPYTRAILGQAIKEELAKAGQPCPV